MWTVVWAVHCSFSIGYSSCLSFPFVSSANHSFKSDLSDQWRDHTLVTFESWCNWGVKVWFNNNLELPQSLKIPQSQKSYFPPYGLQSLTPILPSSYVSTHVFPPSATLARYSSISPSQCAWSWLAEWRATCQSLRSTKLRKETSSRPPLLPPPPPTNNQMHLARFLPRTPPHHHHLHSSFILPYVHIADL